MTQNIKLINADVIAGLRSIDKDSVDTVITSPPYWGLRDYQIDGQIGNKSNPKKGGTEKQFVNPQNPIGKNPGDAWKIATQPHKDAHFAIFPDKLVIPLVKAGRPKNGVVLDPFAGSGTTMKVAKALGRSAIGIELSPEYCDIIKRNLLFHQHTLGI